MIGITSGPGFGKTSIIEELEKRGMPVAHEAARDLIAAGELERQSLLGFQHLVAKTTIERQAAAGPEGVVDRPVADVLAYLRVLGPQEAPYLESLAARHMPRRVFLLEPLPRESYCTDTERQETYEEALTLHRAIAEVYESFGADVVRVPFFPSTTAPEGIAKRTAYLLERLPPDDHLENEQLFRADHHVVRSRLAGYRLLSGHAHELTQLYDIAGIFTRNGRRLRLREDGQHTLTIKGGYRGGASRTRREVNLRLPGGLARIVGAALPRDVEYENHTEWYVPHGDPTTSIHLDRVTGLGEFVEVEAPTDEQIARWRQRLGLGEPLSDGYPEMLRRAS